MSDLRQAAQQALEFCEFLWREVCLNDYAEEKREETELALRAALAQEQSDAVSQAVANRLGQLPEPVAWFRAPYGTLEPNPLFRVSGPQSLKWAVACFTEDQLRAAVAAEREQWRRIAEAAQAVTEGAEDIGDFRVSSTLMAALALALDEGPNVRAKPDPTA